MASPLRRNPIRTKTGCSFTDTSRRRNESSRVDEGEGERQRHKIKHPETARQIE
jgi:hypothetical protein